MYRLNAKDKESIGVRVSTTSPAQRMVTLSGVRGKATWPTSYNRPGSCTKVPLTLLSFLQMRTSVRLRVGSGHLSSQARVGFWVYPGTVSDPTQNTTLCYLCLHTDLCFLNSNADPSTGPLHWLFPLPLALPRLTLFNPKGLSSNAASSQKPSMTAITPPFSESVLLIALTII